MNPSLQPMNRTPHDLELRVIVSGERGCTVRLQLANARLNTRLIDADYFVMFVLNAKGLRERGNQVFLVHLRVALDGIVFDAFGDLSQIGDGLVFQFFVCVRHEKLLCEK
jgi:hypothetical protein